MTSENLITQTWGRVPVIVRGIFSGLLVSTIGVLTWLVVATIVPPPLSVAIMGLVLYAFVQYFRGRWALDPHNNRKLYFRSVSLPSKNIGWIALACLSLLALYNSGIVVTFRLVQFNPETFKTAAYFDAMPPLVAWPLIIMSSMVAGICEETGFRGYMQKPIELRYGAAWSIVITSIVFVLVHLHQAWAGGILPQVFLVSVTLGYLAYVTNSLIPGILVHTVFDIVNFSYWWSSISGTFTRSPIGVTGIDLHFIITLSILFISILLFVMSCRTILQKKGNQITD